VRQRLTAFRSWRRTGGSTGPAGQWPKRSRESSQSNAPGAGRRHDDLREPKRSSHMRRLYTGRKKGAEAALAKWRQCSNGSRPPSSLARVSDEFAIAFPDRLVGSARNRSRDDWYGGNASRLARSMWSLRVGGSTSYCLRTKDFSPLCHIRAFISVEGPTQKERTSCYAAVQGGENGFAREIRCRLVSVTSIGIKAIDNPDHALFYRTNSWKSQKEVRCWAGAHSDAGLAGQMNT